MSAPAPIRYPSRTSIVGEDTQIRRALPNRERRMVGAWCFLDHLGPVQFAPGKGMHVGPHPHIGLQTFTWMIEGEVVHRDSLGYEQVIRPGQVNLMTAGRGIAHTEDSAQDGAVMHAAQLWIALPDAEKNREPAFQNYADLPTADAGGWRATVLAGSALGLTAPTQVYSPLVGIDFTAAAAADTGLTVNGVAVPGDADSIDVFPGGYTLASTSKVYAFSEDKVVVESLTSSSSSVACGATWLSGTQRTARSTSSACRSTMRSDASRRISMSGCSRWCRWPS